MHAKMEKEGRKPCFLSKERQWCEEHGISWWQGHYSGPWPTFWIHVPEGHLDLNDPPPLQLVFQLDLHSRFCSHFGVTDMFSFNMRILFAPHTLFSPADMCAILSLRVQIQGTKSKTGISFRGSVFSCRGILKGTLFLFCSGTGENLFWTRFINRHLFWMCQSDEMVYFLPLAASWLGRRSGIHWPNLWPYLEFDGPSPILTICFPIVWCLRRAGGFLHGKCEDLCVSLSLNMHCCLVWSKNLKRVRDLLCFFPHNSKLPEAILFVLLLFCERWCWWDTLPKIFLLDLIWLPAGETPSRIKEMLKTCNIQVPIYHADILH